MKKYIKILFTVLIISISITSCRKYFDLEWELFPDFRIEVYGNEVLFLWETTNYASSEGTLYLSTSQNPTKNSVNTIRINANNKLNRNKGWWICYDANGYHIHDLYADNAYESKDPSSWLYCRTHYNYYGFEISQNNYYGGFSHTSCCVIVEGLTPKTTYYARVYTTIDGNDAYSEQISFTTK